MRKVFVSRRIFPEALRLLEAEDLNVHINNSRFPLSDKRLKERVKGVDGLICFLNDRIDREFLEEVDTLIGISNVAAGVDNIDLEAARESGIYVTNVPGAVTRPTADLTFTLILTVARKVSAGERYLRNGQSQDWELMGPLLGTEVSGKSLGIIGMGRIGSAVARRAALGFEMDVLYHSRTRKKQLESEIGLEYVTMENLLQRSDFVSLHTPLTEETRGMMGRDQFKLMKNTAFLVNTSRGEVIEEEELINALERGELAGAALDVFCDEPKVNPKLLEFGSRVVVTPHIGSATRKARARMAEVAVKDMIKILNKESPDHPVVNPIE